MSKSMTVLSSQIRPFGEYPLMVNSHTLLGTGYQISQLVTPRSMGKGCVVVTCRERRAQPHEVRQGRRWWLLAKK